MPFPAMPDEVLGDLLRALGPELVVPAAASLPDDVRRRIAASPAPARAPWWRPQLAPRTLRRALIVALALVLLIAALAGAARLGVPGISIVVGPSTASLPPTPSPAPTDAPPGASAGLGTAATEAEAVAALGRPLPVLPAPYGPPDAIYVDTLGRGIVNQVWGPAPGRPLANDQGVSMLLTAMRATTEVELVKKLIDGGARITFTSVAGADAFWIEGAHDVLVLGEDGNDVLDLRVAGDVLLWSDGVLTYRMESALGQTASIALAETMTARP